MRCRDHPPDAEESLNWGCGWGPGNTSTGPGHGPQLLQIGREGVGPVAVPADECRVEQLERDRAFGHAVGLHNAGARARRFQPDDPFGAVHQKTDQYKSVQVKNFVSPTRFVSVSPLGGFGSVAAAPSALIDRDPVVRPKPR